MIRSYAFAAAYWLLSAFYVIVALPLLMVPGNSVIRWWIRQYTRSMRWSLHHLAGVKVDIRGREHLPEGPFVIAAKHQSWGDGFLIYPEIEDIAFVTGDHLERFPFVKGILKKLGAIVIDTCGGGERKAASLAEGLERIASEGRRILIYPEGHLAPVGYHFRYKPGVWHMAKTMNVPIVPVATNLGLYWSQEDFKKTPGRAVLQFLPAINPGTDKAAVMQEVTDSIETTCAKLNAEALGTSVQETKLIPDPQTGTLASAPETPSPLSN